MRLNLSFNLIIWRDKPRYKLLSAVCCLRSLTRHSTAGQYELWSGCSARNWILQHTVDSSWKWSILLYCVRRHRCLCSNWSWWVVVVYKHLIIIWCPPIPNIVFFETTLIYIYILLPLIYFLELIIYCDTTVPLYSHHMFALWQKLLPLHHN